MAARAQGLSRLALNLAVYFVLGGGVLSFVGLRGGEGNGAARAPVELSHVLLAALAVAVWSGGLTTWNEVVVLKKPRALPRALLAAVVGALSLGGFATILSLVAWGAPAWGFIAIGVAAGGFMQGARAFALGERAAVRDATDATDEATPEATPESSSES